MRLPDVDLGLIGLSFFPTGVLLHVMGDALGSVVVVITAIIFYVLPLKREDPCNWQCYIDPSLTVVMVIIILSSAFPLIKETATILLQMVPKGVIHGDSPGKNTGVGCHALLQGIFPTQGSKPGILHCRQILYHLSHQEAHILSHNKRKILPFVTT